MVFESWKGLGFFYVGGSLASVSDDKIGIEVGEFEKFLVSLDSF